MALEPKPMEKPDLLMTLVKYARAEVAAKVEAKAKAKATLPPTDAKEANRLAAKLDEILRWHPKRYVALVATTRCTCCSATWQNFLGLFIEEYDALHKCLRKRRLRQLPDDDLPRERHEYLEVEEVNECPNCIDLSVPHHQLKLALPAPVVDPDVSEVLNKVLKALGVIK